MDEEARYVLAIYEHGTISTAAHHAHLSQPALSKKLKTIEKRLGAELFDRTRRPLEPTHAGRAYLAFAKRVVSAENRMVREVGAIACNAKRHLTIGVSAPRCDTLLADVIERFYHDTSGCTLSLIAVDSSDHLNELLSDERIDFAAMTPSEPDRGLFAVKTICEEHLQLFVPVSLASSLCGKANPNAVIEPALIGRLPFIMPPKSWPLNWIICTSLDSLGVQIEVVMHSCSSKMTLEMIHRGLGVSIMPSTFDFNKHAQDVVRFDIAGMEQGNGLVLAYRRNWNPSRDARSFIGILETWMDEHPPMFPLPQAKRSQTRPTSTGF